MRHRYPGHTLYRTLRPPLPRRPLILYLAAFILLLTAVVAIGAHAQEATIPPPPPPDQSTAEPSASQSSVRVVRLSDVEGQVQVYENGQLTFDQAEPNMPAVEGMRFVTGDNGRLEIEFEDGSVARVTPDSSIRLAVLRRKDDGSTVTEIDALSGLTYYELNGSGSQYSVHFASDAATPVGSAVFRVDLDSIPNQLAVMHGSVHVDDGPEAMLSLDVHPSQTFQTDPQQPGEFTIAQSLSADSWDQWNSDRDQALSQLESGETVARDSSANPDDPAWNDLDYYGNWYDLPGYGQVWSPAGVGADWDPFGDGYWGYYNSFGYTWISGYPWGWWPYHCGAWDYLDAWGWIWAPGNCGWGLSGNGWYPYATVWGVPPNYLPPARPHRLPHHGVGPPRATPRPENLIAIHRGDFAAPFRFQPGSRPAPRALLFNGKSIEPAEATIHPMERGPIGESYTTALVRAHPEMGVLPGHGTPSFGATGSTFRPAYAAPGEPRPFGPLVRFTAPHSFGPSSAGSHPSESRVGGGEHVSGGHSDGGGHPAGGSHGGGSHR